jgi:glycosyltransferase involved in cell wall biosynthesis
MKVLVLNHEYPPVGGGGGRVSEDIARGLVQRGHDVVLLTAHLEGLNKDELQDGVRVIRIPSGRKEAFKASFIDMGRYILAGIFPGLQWIRSWQPDVIHVHFAVPGGVLGWLLSRLTAVPYVLTVHLGDVPGATPEKTGRWFRWIFPFTPPIWKGAEQICAVSEFTRNLAQKSYPLDMQVIPNGVDLVLLDPKKIQVGVPPRLIFAGRFVNQKNPLQIVRSLAAVQDLSWTCIMIGDGPLRPEVESEIARYGLGDRIDLSGWITPNEVIDWFAQSDILFMPSLSEGLPVVGVQAVAMGLAIVAGRAGGFVDLVEPGVNGYLLDGSSTTAGIAELRGLLSSPQQLRDFRNASRKIAHRFDIQEVVKAYQRVLEDAVQK